MFETRTERHDDNGVYLILRELGKSIGHVLVPMGSSSQIWATSKGDPDWDVIRAAIGFLDDSVLGRAKEYLRKGNANQAIQILSIAYPRLRLYMCPPMWDLLFRSISENSSENKRPGPAPSPETASITTYFESNEQRIIRRLSRDTSLKARQSLALEITRRVLDSSSQKPDARVMRSLRNLVKELITKRRDSKTGF